MKRSRCFIALTFVVVWTVNAQTAQDRFEEFRKRTVSDYNKFRDEALNRYESYMEQAWKEYEVAAGRRRDDTPKPIARPTVSEEEKEAILANNQMKTMVAKPDTTNAWFENLRWEGSRLEQWVDKGVDQLRKVEIKKPAVLVTLSDVARDRRKAIAERIRKIGTISEDYVAPSELRRIRRENLAAKLLAENASKDSGTPSQASPDSQKKEPESSKDTQQPKQAVKDTEKIQQETKAPMDPTKENPSTQAVAQVQKASPVAPVVQETEPEMPVKKTVPTIDFELYGLELSVPTPGIAPQKINVMSGTTGNALRTQAVNYWKKINGSNLTPVLDALTEISLFYSFGDWCTFKAVETYAAAWATGNEEAKCIMAQYLMLNMGYDVRLAIAGNKLIMLLPFEQEVYGTSYITVSDKRFYLYPNIKGASISTVTIPNELLCDRINLIQTAPIALPRDNQAYTVRYGDLRIEGNVNLNIIKMQQEVPLMDSPCYAASMYDDSLHLAIVDQLKKQVEGMSEEVAANALLHFVEHGFEYKTDREQFGEGVEKPFFFEEILYHPYCDCEDRAIFYSYLVRQILGLDVVLVHFPGHACTAVAFTNPPTRRTVTYTYKGRNYYICDPTYITADVGMCPPRYLDLDPTFMEWYYIEEL